MTAETRELCLALSAFMRKHEDCFGGPCPCGLCWKAARALEPILPGAYGMLNSEIEEALK